MADWLAIVASLLGGGAAAGAAFYIVGRRVQRGAAEAAARAAAEQSARLLEEARQRMVLAAKEELLGAREAWDEEVARRRREIDRREQGLEERGAALEERDRGLERRGRVLEERERALAATELEARARPERIAGLTAQEAKQELLRRPEDKARGEVDASIVEAGEQAIYETGIKGMHPELVKLVGRMKYRTSYGQNILDHSKEVAWLAGIMAAELKLDAQLAKRGALLHDIGKVLTHEHDGTHVQLGV